MNIEKKDGVNLVISYVIAGIAGYFVFWPLYLRNFGDDLNVLGAFVLAIAVTFTVGMTFYLLQLMTGRIEI